MANGQSYQKYGGAASLDISGLVKSQQAVGDGFKDAFKGVQDLLKQTEDQYKETNTLNMQEYLKGQIKSAGLGAEPIDREAIKQKFGSLINVEALEKTIGDTTTQMTNDALDDASGYAGQAFAESEDIVKAGNVYQERLRALGMKEGDVAKQGQTWRLDNQYLAEEVQLTNARMVDDIVTGTVTDLISSAGNLSPEDALNARIANAPGKIKTPAILKARETIKALGKMDDEQVAEYDHIARLSQQKIDALDQEMAAVTGAAKTALEKINYLPQAAYEGAKALQSKLGGMSDPIADDATGQFFEWGRLEEGEVSQALQGHIDALIDRKMPPDEAYGIAFQAYSEAKADGGIGFTGVAIDPEMLKSKVDKYAGLYAEKQVKEAKYRELLADGLKKRTALMAERENLLESLRKGETFSNISGKPYDSKQTFASSIFAREKAAPQTVPSPPTKPPTTDKPAEHNDAPYVIAGVDIGKYATKKGHEAIVEKIYSGLTEFGNAAQIDKHIQRVAPNSPVTGEMLLKSAQKHDVDPKLLAAIMQNDSHYGTKGIGSWSNNPGNVGNNDQGDVRTFDTLEEGIDAAAGLLSKWKVGEAPKGGLLSEATIARAEENRKKLAQAKDAQTKGKELGTAPPDLAKSKKETFLERVNKVGLIPLAAQTVGDAAGDHYKKVTTDPKFPGWW